MAEGKSENGYLVSKGYSYYVFILLFLLYMFDYMDRQVIVSLFPYLKADWGLSDMQCGSLVSAVYWSILLLAFPVSILIDRWSRKNSIGIMAILWSAATLSCAFTHNFTQLFITRTAIGIGEAGYAPGGTALISASFPQRMRAQMMGIWNASIPLGSALGIVIGGFVAQYWGWRYAFGIVALPGLVIAILFFWVKDYKTVELTQTQPQQDLGARRLSTKEIALSFLKTRSLVFSYLGFAANMFVTTAFMAWLPSFYQRTEDCTISSAGMKGASVMAMAIVGAPLGGFIVDRWGRHLPNARMVFGAISSFLTAVTLMAGFVFFEGNVQYAVFLLGGVFASAFIPGIVAVTQDVVHPGLRATSYSINVIVMHILGSSLGPLCVGAISDAYDLKTALTILPLAAMVGALLFFIGSLWYVGDLARVEKVEMEAV
jgi:MFS family permease